ILLALGSIFVGTLLRWAEKTEMIEAIGGIMSSIIVGAGTLVTTIITAILNIPSDKEPDEAHSANVTDIIFKPMFLHIPDDILYGFGTISKTKESIHAKFIQINTFSIIDRDLDRKLRHSIMILGEVELDYAKEANVSNSNANLKEKKDLQKFLKKKLDDGYSGENYV
ncbi:18049_t:CDS:2, partial [Dentiscutata erythropus]